MYSAFPQCSSNGRYFGVCSLPSLCNIVAQRMSGEAYTQKELIVSVADGNESCWGKGGNRMTKTPNKTKRDREGKEKGKVFSVASWKDTR